MGFIRKSHLAKKYGVTPKTVDSWLKNAILGKNNIQFGDFNGINQILDTMNNELAMQNLADEGRKHKSYSSFERVHVDSEINHHLNSSHIIELVSYLESERIIPLKFAYLNGGANSWDQFVVKSYDDKNAYFKEDANCIKANLEAITAHLVSYKSINIIEVGPGNGLATKPIVDFLLQKQIPICYHAIDISQKMLDIVTKNFRSWYPGLSFSCEIGDMENVIIRNRLFNLKMQNPDSCNLIMMLGGTIGNVNDRHRTFFNFSSSMSLDDFLLIDNSIDKVKNRSKFVSFEQLEMARFTHWLPEKLGFKVGINCEEISKYREETGERVKALKLLADFEIIFDFEKIQKILNFTKGEEIVFWNHHSSIISEFLEETKKAGLKLTHFATIPEKNGFLSLMDRVAE